MPLSSTQMLHLFSTLSHMYITKTSDVCTGISVDLINGTATVLYNNGSVYKYTNVSRRAIVNLMLNPNMSLGFWINANLINSNRVSYAQTYVAVPTV